MEIFKDIGDIIFFFFLPLTKFIEILQGLEICL